MIKRFAALLWAAVLLAVCGCSSAGGDMYTGFYFDTVVSITAYGAEAGQIEHAFRMCAEYERLFSRTAEGSDVWRLNHAEGSEITVDGETAQLLGIARSVSEASGGAFDITAAACSELWDFENAVFPDERELAEAVRLADYTAVELSGTRVRITNGGSIDLGGIAKGYIADRLAEYFAAEGLAAIVNIGGDIAFSEKNPQGRPWRIGIRDISDKTKNACYVNTDMAVVTSGVYERGFTYEGKRYHHILNPDTGFPAQSGIASATVLAGTAAEADALSTACIVLGAEDGLKLIDDYEGAEAVFITNEGQIICTKEAEDMLDG